MKDKLNIYSCEAKAKLPRSYSQRFKVFILNVFESISQMNLTNLKESSHRRNKSCKSLIESPIIHQDEILWILIVIYMCYRRDFWVLGFMLLEPMIV